MVFAMVVVRVSTIAKSDVHGQSFDVNCVHHCLHEPPRMLFVCLFLHWLTDILK